MAREFPRSCRIGEQPVFSAHHAGERIRAEDTDVRSSTVSSHRGQSSGSSARARPRRRLGGVTPAVLAGPPACHPDASRRREGGGGQSSTVVGG